MRSMKKTWTSLCICVFLFCLLSWNCALAVQQETEDLSLPVFAINAEAGLPALLAAMAGRKAVLLGDGTHGTEEFYAFRKLITRKLIRDYGYRVLILEAEWDSAEQFDLYIRNRLQPPPDSRAFLAGAFSRWPQWVWANEEMVEFMEWLKLFNLENAGKSPVHCFGMDMQLAVQSSLAFLLRQFPAEVAFHDRFQDLHDWWQPYINDPILFNRAYVAGQETGSLLATELLGAISNSVFASFEVAWRLKMLAAAEEYYRTMSFNQYEAWNIRSRYFAEYVLAILARDEAKGGVIIWAHNSHLGDMAGSDVQGTGLINLGNLLRRFLGAENVFILGSTSYKGTVSATSEWGGQVREIEAPPAADGSLEAVLESGGWDNPLLLFRTEDERARWSQPMLHRGIGVTYDPTDEHPTNYLITRVSKRYDALVFWRKTRSLQLLAAP